MATALFEIAYEIRLISLKMEEWADEHDGDITEFPMKDAFNAIQMDMEEQALEIGLLIKELTVLGKSIVGEGQPFIDLGESYKKRGETKLNAAARLRNYLHDFLPTSCKYENEKVLVRRQKTGGVEPVELMPEVTPEELPEKYQKVIREANIEEIRRDAEGFEEGEDLPPGCSRDSRYIFDGDKPLAVVKPRGTHIRVI